MKGAKSTPGVCVGGGVRGKKSKKSMEIGRQRKETKMSGGNEHLWEAYLRSKNHVI